MALALVVRVVVPLPLQAAPWMVVVVLVVVLMVVHHLRHPAPC